MKFLIPTIVLAALTNAAPNPHRHNSEAETLLKKGAASQYTDASQDDCIDQMECYTVSKYNELKAPLSCEWPKIARYVNDGSCHRCPSVTCQYIFGNRYGNYVPCRNAGNVADGVTLPTYKARVGGEIVVRNIVNSDGVGQPLTDPVLGITIADPVTLGSVEFCDDDVAALAAFNAAQPEGQCGPWKYATIVSPANCHHCQKIRCMPVYALYRYKDFMNSVNLVSNNQHIDFIRKGLATLNDDYEQVTAQFHCGMLLADESTYQVIHHFCINTATKAYIAGSLTGDMDLECEDDETLVKSNDIPAGIAVTPWLKKESEDDANPTLANDAGCTSVETFTGYPTYILSINSPQWQILVPYPNV